MHTVRVWDLPTRLFHWALAFAVVGLLVTGSIGAEMMPWHFRLGYTVWTLLLFRIVWGFVGGRWSRFKSFVYAPRTVWGYLRGHGTAGQRVGHSPLGAVSVWLMLLFLLAQVGTGLLSDDEMAASGPFSVLVPALVIERASWYHSQVGKPVLIALLLLHVAALGYYAWRKKDNLLTPMLVGDKQLVAPHPASRDDAVTRSVALLVLAVCAASVAGLLRLGG